MKRQESNRSHGGMARQVLLRVTLLLVLLTLIGAAWEGLDKPGQVPIRQGVLSPCPGDVDADSSRGLSDLIRLMGHLTGLGDPLEGLSLQQGDVNFDGQHTIGDAAILLGHMLRGGGLPSCAPLFGDEPRIRAMAPYSGPAGTIVGIVGNRFNPGDPSLKILLESGTEKHEVAVDSASDRWLRFTIPDITNDYYVLSVLSAGVESNATGLTVQAEVPDFQLQPPQANILPTPGSGIDYLVLGGGIPPYELLPLSEQDATRFSVELVGNIVRVESLDDTQAGVRLSFRDSDPSGPNFFQGNVFQFPPEFTPSASLHPFSTQAGTSPAMRIRIWNQAFDLRTRRIEMAFSGMKLDLPQVEAGYPLGMIQIWDDWIIGLQLLVATRVDGQRTEFEVRDYSFPASQRRAHVVANGVFDEGANGLNLEILESVPESLNPLRMQFDLILPDAFFVLPNAASAECRIVTNFTSVTVLEDSPTPFRHRTDSFFRTRDAGAGAPIIERVVRLAGAPGQSVLLFGKNFADTPAGNRVMMRGLGGNQEAEVTSATPEILEIVVPEDAVGGVIWVEVDGKKGNEYEYRVYFHATVDGEMALNGEIPIAPTFTIRHRFERDFAQNPEELPVGGARFSFSAGAPNVDGLENSFDIVGYVTLEKNGAMLRKTLCYIPEPMESGSLEFAECGNQPEIYFRTREFENGGFEISMDVVDPLPDGAVWTIEFEHPIFQPAEGGGPVTIEVSAFSQRWSPLRELGIEVRKIVEVTP